MPDRTGGMRCPIHNAPPVMSERAGIEIDYCPTSRGVWPDRGELDKLAELSARGAGKDGRRASRAEPRRENPRHMRGTEATARAAMGTASPSVESSS